MLYKRYASPIIKDEDFKIVEIKEDKAPFSFWVFIYINPSKYEWETFNQILQHEKIHIAQKHTFDILLGEFLVIVQWFNPFAWLYRKAIENNLEYLTDDKMLALGTNKETYQMNLLKVSVPDLPINLTTNYNQSILKKRIIMMNSKKSSVSSSWKYLFLFPLLGLSIISLNSVKTTAQTYSFSDQEEQKVPPSLFTEPQEVELEPFNPTPKQETGNSTINPVVEIKENSNNTISNFNASTSEFSTTGSWTGELKNQEFCVRLQQSKNRYKHWSMHRCFDASNFKGLNANAENFQLKREAGTISFQGKLINGEGGGKFNFEPNAAFVTYLQQEGFRQIDDELMFFLCISNINKAYFDYLKKEGYTNISDDELKALAHHGLDLKDLQEKIPAYRDYGFNRIDIEDLIALSIHDVSPAYLKEMKSLGFRDLSIDEVVAARIHDVSPEFLKELADAGYSNMDIEDVIGFAIHDVDAEYIKNMKELGFKNLDKDEIVAAKIHNVSPEFLQELADAGYSNMDIDDVIGFAIHDVDAEYIKNMKELGFKNLDKDEIIAAKIHDVSPEFLQELANAGYTNMNIDDVIGFAIHDVDAEYIKNMKELGFKNLNKDEIVGSKIHDISPAYIRSLGELGLENLSIDDAISLSIHDVSPQYVKGLRDLGYQNISVEDATQASIHDLSLNYIKNMHELGFEKASLEDLISAAIHDLSPSFIQQARADGYKDLDLEEYIDLKIHTERFNRKKEH